MPQPGRLGEPGCLLSSPSGGLRQSACNNCVFGIFQGQEPPLVEKNVYDNTKKTCISRYMTHLRISRGELPPLALVAPKIIYA